MVIVLSATFNTNAIDSFFTGADQLSLSIYTRDQMVVEGISSHVDLPEFNKDGVSSIVRAFERPPQVPNGAGDLVNQTPFQFPAKSQKRFVIAIEISDYYNQTNQEVSLTMMMWQTLKSYSIQMLALYGTSNPSNIVPIKSSIPMTKFREYFRSHLSTIVGLRKCPLDYFIRAQEIPTIVEPVFLRDKPHSEENGSVEGELRARLSFTNTLFQSYSAKVFQELSKGLVGSKYAATIARFRDVNGRMDGRGAYFAAETQSVSQAVWEEQIKTSDD